MPMDVALQQVAQNIRNAIRGIQTRISVERPIGDLAHLGSALKLLVDADFEICQATHTERQRFLQRLDDQSSGGPPQTQTSAA